MQFLEAQILKDPRIAIRITWVVMAENSFFEASRAFLRAVKSEISTIPRDPTSTLWAVYVPGVAGNTNSFS